jgi:cytosine/uracil/thiamine/allantoin permease
LRNTNLTKTNNDLQNTTQKSKDWVTQTPLKTNNHLLFCVVFCISLFVLSEVCVAQSSLFCVVFFISLFVFSEVFVVQSSLFCVESLKTNNDLQNPTQKSKDWATQISLKTNNDLQNTTQKSKDWASSVYHYLFLVRFEFLNLYFSV